MNKHHMDGKSARQYDQHIEDGNVALNKFTIYKSRNKCYEESTGEVIMNSRQERIHKEAIQLTKVYKKVERDLIEVFIEAEETKLYRELDKASMFQYATETLGLSESVAYNFITVARSAKRVPALRQAVAQEAISVAKAGRIAAHVEKDQSLIDFAATHSKREIEIEVAKLNPLGEPVNRIKIVNAEKAHVTVTISHETLAALERIQSLLAQKDLPATLSDAVEACAHQFIDRKDPVKVAKRNEAELCPGRVGELTAPEKHAVYNRDQGRCTHLDHTGKRCNSDRWTEIHHIIERQNGGSNDPENLTILCGFHHRRRHRH